MEESSVAIGYENVFFKNKTVVVDLSKNIAVLNFVEMSKILFRSTNFLN